ERFLASGLRPDLIVASDMLDLTSFLALTRPLTAQIPAAVYFHENQLTYPPAPRLKHQQHYAVINYLSALAADTVFFNSDFHRSAFFDELPRLLKHFPDYNNLHTISALRDKSTVLPLGLDLSRFDDHRPAAPRDPARPPLILGNQRWEYVKNPEPFFAALNQLAEEGIVFEVALVGENERQEPAEFETARAHLGDRVVQYGYVESFAAYARLLWQADIAASTSNQDFFGVSVAEAIYCGGWPVLPNRLNYPALIPAERHAQVLYPDDNELVNRLRAHLSDLCPAPPELRAHIAQFDWREMASRYDAAFSAITTRPSSKSPQ
ncbi:MAG: DUF3524 domain-containing protein, partial [Chloroflexi bacterium]|nr:DUF3524 domain-containing protein [Chloroflexota bacterium]